MNSFGRIFRVSIYGESHGQEVGVLIDGCPSGIAVHLEDLQAMLNRRRPGAKGTTPRSEDDVPMIRSGVFKGFTTGTPILLGFPNQNIRSEFYEQQRNVFRPGHADFTGHIKYQGFEDYRGGGHFSGRLTVGLVAAGYFAQQILIKSNPQITLQCSIVEVGGKSSIEEGISWAINRKDSVGGLLTCKISGIPSGLGEPFFDAAESLISHLVMAIPGIRGIEFGTGFQAAKMTGSEHNDSITDASGRTSTNHAGGINGGITNGNDIIFTVAVKPSSSTPYPQTSLNFETGEMESLAVKGRHDLCIALRMPVIIEAAAAIVLSDLLLLSTKH